MRIQCTRVLLMSVLAISCPACMMPGVPAPVAPAAAGVGPAAIDGAPAAAAAAAPTGIEKCCDALDKCRRKLCNTPFGQMLNSMTKPISTLTGGVIPTFCPGTPGLDDLAKPGVLGEAAAVSKDAAEAKARRAAVRQLGTVDCRYYPEAEGKLLAALRTDGSECVRYEAALALSRGCCCSKKVIDALTICVDGSEDDGAPAERSERVRDTAAIGLQRCISCVKVVEEPTVLPDPKTPEGEIDAPKKKDTLPKDDENKPKLNQSKVDAKSVQKARDVLAKHQANRETILANTPNSSNQIHSLYDMFRFANESTDVTTGLTTAPLKTELKTETANSAKIVNTKPIEAQVTSPTTASQAPKLMPTTPIVVPSAGFGPVIPPAPLDETPAVKPLSEVKPEPEVIPTSVIAVPTTESPAVIQPPAIQAEAPPVPPSVLIRPVPPLPTSPFPE